MLRIPREKVAISTGFSALLIVKHNVDSCPVCILATTEYLFSVLLAVRYMKDHQEGLYSTLMILN